MRVQFKGFRECLATLKHLRKAQAKSIWRKGVRAAAGVVLKAARPLVSKESGTARKSLALRIKARRKDGMIVGIVGPRQKYQKEFKGRIRKPSKYAHLIEKGRRARVAFSLRRGPYLIRGVKARSFLNAAMKRASAQALQAMQEKIKQEMLLL